MVAPSTTFYILQAGGCHCWFFGTDGFTRVISVLTKTLWLDCHCTSFRNVQFSCVQRFATPWTGARQASLSITNSRSLLKLMSIESVMPSNHLILCRPLLLLPSIFPSIRVFSNESVLCISWPRNEEARTKRIDCFAQDPKLSQQQRMYLTLVSFFLFLLPVMQKEHW